MTHSRKRQNLIANSTHPPEIPDIRPQVSAAADSLRNWKVCPDRAAKIVYLLEHSYTEAALSFDALKGPDAARAPVVIAAAGATGFTCHRAYWQPIHSRLQQNPQLLQTRPRTVRKRYHLNATTAHAALRQVPSIGPP